MKLFTLSLFGAVTGLLAQGPALQDSRVHTNMIPVVQSSTTNAALRALGAPQQLTSYASLAALNPDTGAQVVTVAFAGAPDLTYRAEASDPGFGWPLVATNAASLKFWVARPTAFNAKWAGAVGDGTTDDRDAMQLAFNAAALSSRKVVIPKGDYKIPYLRMSSPAYGTNSYGNLFAGKIVEIIGEGNPRLLFCNRDDYVWADVPQTNIVTGVGYDGTRQTFTATSGDFGLTTALNGKGVDIGQVGFLLEPGEIALVKGITFDGCWSSDLTDYPASFTANNMRSGVRDTDVGGGFERTFYTMVRTQSQGFGNGLARARFEDCTFKNAPGSAIGGTMLQVFNCRFENAGDHSIYIDDNYSESPTPVGGTIPIDQTIVSNCTFLDTRTASGSGATAIFEVTAPRLKFRDVGAIVIDNNAIKGTASGVMGGILIETDPVTAPGRAVRNIRISNNSISGSYYFVRMEQSNVDSVPMMMIENVSIEQNHGETRFLFITYYGANIVGMNISGNRFRGASIALAGQMASELGICNVIIADNELYTPTMYPDHTASTLSGVRSAFYLWGKLGNININGNTFVQNEATDSHLIYWGAPFGGITRFMGTSQALPANSEPIVPSKRVIDLNTGTNTLATSGYADMGDHVLSVQNNVLLGWSGFYKEKALKTWSSSDAYPFVTGAPQEWYSKNGTFEWINYQPDKTNWFAHSMVNYGGTVYTNNAAVSAGETATPNLGGKWGALTRVPMQVTTYGNYFAGLRNFTMVSAVSPSRMSQVMPQANNLFTYRRLSEPDMSASMNRVQGVTRHDMLNLVGNAMMWYGPDPNLAAPLGSSAISSTTGKWYINETATSSGWKSIDTQGLRSTVTTERTSLDDSTDIVSGDVGSMNTSGWPTITGWTDNIGSFTYGGGASGSLASSTVINLAVPGRTVTVTVTFSGTRTCNSGATLAISFGGNVIKTFSVDPGATETFSGQTGTSGGNIILTGTKNAGNLDVTIDTMTVTVHANGDWLHRHTYSASTLTPSASAAPWVDISASGSFANSAAKTLMIGLSDQTVSMIPVAIGSFTTSADAKDWILTGRLRAIASNKATFRGKLEANGETILVDTAYDSSLVGNFLWGTAGYIFIGANADGGDADVTVNESSVEYKP